jgi:hypothetical protein
MRRATLVVVAMTAVVLLGCASPESRRTRGGGPGADVGNRDDVVLMHEGSKPYAGTPRIRDITGPSLEPSEQAHRLSR